jgi:hypothetical protein
MLVAALGLLDACWWVVLQALMVKVEITQRDEAISLIFSRFFLQWAGKNRIGGASLSV